jgi:hypothetical protein
MSSPPAPAVNLDTNTALTFVSEGSFVRSQLKSFVQGKQMVMTQTAADEFQQIIAVCAGPLEQARAIRFLARVVIVPDQPSPRASRLKPTKNLEP